MLFIFVSIFITSCNDFTSGSGSSYKVGDLVLSDGTVIPYIKFRQFTNEQKQKAVAVIFKTRKGSYRPLGVGLRQPNGLQWAITDSVGYSTSFKAIQCTPYKDGKESFGSWDKSKTWKGDVTGKDNWKEICKVDTVDTKNPSKNYPAFNYALNYGTTANITGLYQKDWFLPSMPELVELWLNKEIVNNVLKALGTDYAQELKTGWYWSSSQDDNTATDALDCNFSSGSIDDFSKNTTSNGYVCVVREF